MIYQYIFDEYGADALLRIYRFEAYYLPSEMVPGIARCYEKVTTDGNQQAAIVATLNKYIVTEYGVSTAKSLT